jgi:hypothetical protein
MFEALKQIRPPAAWQALSWSSAPPTSPKTYRDPLAPWPLSEPGGGLGSPGSSTPGDEGRGECEQHKPFRSSHGEEADTLNPG